MIVRLITISLLVLGLTGAAFVFDAASRTALALDILADARASESEPVRDQLLDQAETTLLQSWARAPNWHAGASEALSGILFEKAAAHGDAALYADSAKWAAHTVHLAPVQPHAWIRLALLSELGHANPLCSLRECLDTSWAVAAMLEPDAACTRLQIAHRAGMLTPNDPRIDAYLRGGASRRHAAQCLIFLEPHAMFETLARQRRR